MKKLEGICKAVINDSTASPALKDYARKMLVGPHNPEAEAIRQAADIAWLNGISAAEYQSRILAHADAIGT